MVGEYCVVFVTVGTASEAEKIASTVVEERLAACCNLIPGIRSVYRWQGKICRDEETLLIMKTRRERFEALRARVATLHGYEVPEIIALPIAAGHAAYLEWLCEGTAG